MTYLRLLLFFLVCPFGWSMSGVQGWCELGATPVVTANITSTTKTQGSFPQCTVAVYLSGTTTLASPIYDASGTPLSNPFTATTQGAWFFQAPNAKYDVKISGGGLPGAYTFPQISLLVDSGSSLPGSCSLAGSTFFLTSGTPALYACNGSTYQLPSPNPNATFQRLNNIRFSSQFPGSDCGAQINAAYADLPSTGGIIIQDVSCSYTTPIVFNTNLKPALLEGFPAGAITLTYTATTGTAMTLNYGTGLTMGKGFRDLTLTGPGNSTSTTGVIIGGANGAQGTTIDNSEIQSFGTNVLFANNTWIVDIRQTMIRDGGTNVLFPTSVVNAGENIKFDHVTFADAPPPHTNSVWMQSSESEFEDCSFDQAQLRIGNGTNNGAQTVIHGSHFENPNYAEPGSVDYVFIVMDQQAANYIRLTDSFFEQDRQSGGAYDRFITAQGGVLHISGVGMYSPIPLTNFAVLSNAVNVNLFGWNDLSGGTSNLFGGSTTGYVNSLPGADTNATSGFNNIIGAIGAVGGDFLDVGGNIRGTQLISTATTGTQAILVGSTTPINNLFANAIFTSGGTQITTRTHFLFGQKAVTGSVTVTLTGSDIFTNSSSYACGVNATDSENPVRIQYSSGSQFILSSLGSNVSYICGGY
jgi:hypothetical protein